MSAWRGRRLPRTRRELVVRFADARVPVLTLTGAASSSVWLVRAHPLAGDRPEPALGLSAAMRSCPVAVTNLPGGGQQNCPGRPADLPWLMSASGRGHRLGAPPESTFRRRTGPSTGRSIDAVAALNPTIVVAGHKSVGVPDLPQNLAASQQYLRDFSTVAKQASTVDGLVNGMLRLHGERDHPHTLWISARAEVARQA